MGAIFDARDAHLETLLGEGGSVRSYIADNFGKYAVPSELSRFLVRYELFKIVTNVKGSICECGIKSGSGLFQWWHLAKMLDPNGLRRAVIGFDTFAGFPSVHEKDGTCAKVGDLKDTSREELVLCVKMYQMAGLGAPHPIAVVEGNFMQTVDDFLKVNQHIVLSLLYLDFDLYEPTKKALEVFLPRMPKGAVVAFDEVNNHDFPGETLAALESVGIKNLELKQFTFNPDACYAIL